ncbi:YozE family protein [Priestia taiwanensis]|uniref:UPF0346 protein GCM10007140_07770 n=1 Tax=Priestia taiwanensis TaxID=1347902 RepID=A0A917AM22_9BACI|nr:YozE family protein [Priestia taiwanensis]MBM7362154.1 uncharacterized protein YozE (UPF0346 family) [Priestia taiwanensis]GGE59851.1 UPF0346 protein YozE [Priestia taiwanensis]
MSKSFYHFMMKHRVPGSKKLLEQLANNMYDDHDFPKQSYDYDEVSRYLEMNGSYLLSMSLFDEAWTLYESE